MDRYVSLKELMNEYSEPNERRSTVFNAEEAKKLTTKNLRGPVIEPYVEMIKDKIKAAALKGKSSISHPFHGAKDYPSYEVQEATLSHFKSLLFTVQYCDDPDPGDMRSMGAYEVIKW